MAAGLAITVFGVTCTTATDAGAQADPAAFVPGEASAQSTTFLLGLSPGGGKPIEVALGRSTAHYQNTTAKSQGEALGLGLLNVFFGPPSTCGNRPPIIPADQLPPQTTADSGLAQSMAAPIEVHSPGDPGTATTPGTPGGVIGTQIANATPSPQSSTAATTTVTQDYGVLAIDNGASTATTSLIGGVRTATAVTTATRIRVLGDMVVINEPRWEATTTSGGTTTATATFTFKSASILGFERTAANFPGDFGDFANSVAGLLSGLGVTLTYPKVVTADGRITITPLVLSLANPPIGTDFITPLLAFLKPALDEEKAKAVADNCNNETIQQIVDLILGVLGGTGSFTLNAGGATAFTAATVFPDSSIFDAAPPDTTPAPDATAFGATNQQSFVASNTTSRSSSSYGSSSKSSSYDTGVGSDLTAAVPVAAIPETPTTPEAPPTTEGYILPRADLVARRFEPGHRGGPAVAVGLLGLLGLIALAAADRLIMKRTKREIPD